MVHVKIWSMGVLLSICGVVISACQQELMQYVPMARNVGMMAGPRAFPGASHQLGGHFQRMPLRPFHHFGPVPRMPMVSVMSEQCHHPSVCEAAMERSA